MRRIICLVAVTLMTACGESPLVSPTPVIETSMKSEVWILGLPPEYPTIRLVGTCEVPICPKVFLQGNQNYRIRVFTSNPEFVTSESNFVTLTAEGYDKIGGTLSLRFHILGEKDGSYWVKVHRGQVVQTLNISVF